MYVVEPLSQSQSLTLSTPGAVSSWPASSLPFSPMSTSASASGSAQMTVGVVGPIPFIRSISRRRRMPPSFFTDAKPKVVGIVGVRCSADTDGKLKHLKADEHSSGKLVKKKPGKTEHHLWKKRESAGSGQKALHLVRMIGGLSNEKEVVYGALDKWVAWETEFPLIAVAKALRILRERSQWHRVIQVSKWMLGKGQGATMTTYDTLLLAFDKEDRVDEAESLWNMILHTHTRSISKVLFSRMISLYDHHDMPHKIIEVFADMEELRVRPDEPTVKRVAYAFKDLGEEEKQKLVLKKYMSKWKYLHFNGEKVRVRRHGLDDE